MGMLIEGRWATEDRFPTNAEGEFIRKPMSFLSLIHI